MAGPRRVLIMGAAGRDFHNFNTFFRSNPAYTVCAFSATQIPSIDNRDYPAELAGPLYPNGIPIYPEDALEKIIKDEKIDEVIFAYSDVRHTYLMERASRCISLGADFRLLGPASTYLHSSRPVISVLAARTGCGKSGVTRFLAGLIKDAGKRVVVIRHPMPYGDLVKARVQRFATKADFPAHDLTIEELEEYEPLVEAGVTVYAGVDYEAILRSAEAEADIIIWDGGNNDFSFFVPDITFTVLDPLRAGDERSYYPGLVNLMNANFLIINKVKSARSKDIDKLYASIKEFNPEAGVIRTSSRITVEDGEALENKRVLVIEDGPTLTHGGMSFGAGIRGAKLIGAQPVDARPFAIGSIKATLEKHPRLTNLIPAMGYSPAQRAELAESINNTPCDAVLIATPIDLASIIHIKKPSYRVRYDITDVNDQDGPGLRKTIESWLAQLTVKHP